MNVARLTLEQYAGPYLTHVDFTLERRSAAIDLIAAVNAALQMASDDGVVFEVNPGTHCVISGDGLGGFRPQSCPIGAAQSAHKQGQGIDIKEVIGREFGRWCLKNVARLQAAGIRGGERLEWTPSWVHLQTRLVPSGHFWFVPNSSPPLTMRMVEQGAGA